MTVKEKNREKAKEICYRKKKTRQWGTDENKGAQKGRVKQTRRKIRKEDRRRNVMTLKRETDKMTVSPNVERENRETQTGHQGAGAFIFLITDDTTQTDTHTLIWHHGCDFKSTGFSCFRTNNSSPVCWNVTAVKVNNGEQFGLCCSWPHSEDTNPLKQTKKKTKLMLWKRLELNTDWLVDRKKTNTINYFDRWQII